MPSLHISHIVYGRESVGNRVHYFIDTADQEGGKGIPERVVLSRWRKRKRPGYLFSGTRLGPNIWRAVVVVFGTDAKAMAGLDVADISDAQARVKAVLVDQQYELPSPTGLHALFVTLGSVRLQSIIDRHTRPTHADRYGTPDLFLFSTELSTGRYADAHFVEVKKPRERISDDQKEEIAFLASLGLKARVLRLIER